MIAEHIDLDPVESSSVAAFGYNPHKQIAAVQFKNGHVYHMANVPQDLFLEWQAALSKGQYYAMHVKGKFASEKMTGHCPECGAMGWIGETCHDCGCAPVAADTKPEKVGA